MNKGYHSIELIEKKCIGCTSCIKRCPTEAIRVRSGKALINHERCIDCGMCIKVCESHAKKAVTDSLAAIKNFKYKVAIPAPTLYGQFDKIFNVNIILTGLKQLGFDEVFEVSRAADLVTEYTVKLISEGNLKKPVISSACPAVVKLITIKYPALIENILPVNAPVEIMAALAKGYIAKKGINKEDIGVFFISPCAAKRTQCLYPFGLEKSEVDGVISIADIYIKLRSLIHSLNLKDTEVLAHSTFKGVSWAVTGGESEGTKLDSIAVDGVENVMNVLEELENGHLEEIEFIEGLACTGGCVGGPLTVANGFVAKNSLQKLKTFMKRDGALKTREIELNPQSVNFEFTKPLHPQYSLMLDKDMGKALEKLAKIKQLVKELPGIDCGACGSPTCEALAQDIVNGGSNIEDCVFMLRSKVKDMAQAMVSLASKLPQTIQG
ncbi:MAG: 4Fe-4S binding protein [Clostridiales bacterium]|nr:4Fe-4S binding protein [Clostridiales bacterium]